MRLVQIERNGTRKVGVVDGSELRMVDARYPSVYSLVQKAVEEVHGLQQLVESLVASDVVNYDRVYAGDSEWQLLPAFDHPTDPAHCLVSGTGLTHKASARNRAAMHKTADAEATDSFR